MSDEGEIRKSVLKAFATSRHIIRASQHSFNEDEFAPYVTCIGRLLLAWNDLHEKLSLLYVAVTRPEWPFQAAETWHITRADKGKRDLLRCAASEMPINLPLSLKREIEWILGKVTELEGLRDDAAHTPLQYLAPPSADNPFRNIIQSGVRTSFSLGNRRAARLKRAKLIDQFNYARERLNVLRDYACSLDEALEAGHHTLPKRPPLPHPPPTEASKTRVHRTKPK